MASENTTGVFRFLPNRWWSPTAWKSWSAYARWRLETYGVYYPAGRFNFRALLSLLLQIPSYLKWLKQIDSARQKSLHSGNT